MKEKILEETMDFSDDDYKSAIKELYRRNTSEFTQLENTYRSWSQSTQIYALSKADGTGRPVLANIKAYNETIIERKKLAIMLKLIQKEARFLENFWENKGFDIDELKKVTRTKELVKSHMVTKDIHIDKTKEQVAEPEPENKEHIQEEHDEATVETVVVNVDAIKENTEAID